MKGVIRMAQEIKYTSELSKTYLVQVSENIMKQIKDAKAEKYDAGTEAKKARKELREQGMRIW